MGHYKSNLRDIEFNLFEVFGRGRTCSARARTPSSTWTPPAACWPRSTGWPATTWPRPTPTATATRPSSTRPPHGLPCRTTFKQSYRTLMDAEFWRLDLPAELGGTGAPPSLCWALAELVLGANAADLHVRLRPVVRRRSCTQRHRGRRSASPSSSSSGAGARRWCSPSPTPAPTSAPAATRRSSSRRHLAHRGRQALHHQRRARPDREHHPLRARPPGRRRRRRRPGHQGPVAVPRPEVPLRPRDRRARRAQRRLRHQRREQDGPEGLHHLRADLRRDGSPADGWLLGDVHDGIRQMFQVIEYARMMVGTKAIATLSTGYLNALEYAKNRVQGADLTAVTRQDRAARHHHPPPRRAPLAHAAEGVRRGHARAGPLHRDLAGPGRAAGPRRRAPTTRRPSASTTCCCRSSRAAARSGPTSCSAHESLQTLRRLGLPAGLPDRAVHPRRQDRHPLRGHDRDPGPGPVLPQDRAGQGAGPRQAGQPRSRSSRRAENGGARLKVERELLVKALEDVQAILAAWSASLHVRRPEAPAATSATSTRSA